MVFLAPGSLTRHFLCPSLQWSLFVLTFVSPITRDLLWHRNPALYFCIPASSYTAWLTVKVEVKVKSLSPFWLFATPWTVAYQAPPSMGFSRQEYWSGLPLSSPGDLLWSRDRTRVSCIPGRRFNLWAIREPLAHVLVLIVKTSFPSRLWMISLGEDRWLYSSRERGGQNWESWTKKAREGI